MLSTLNTHQREAAEHIYGPIVVVAGAGSGKTRALTHRIAFLLSQGIPAWNILAVTFTNKAAQEMRDRVESLVSEFSEKPLIGTFHSIGVRILRTEFENIGRDRSFSILDSDDTLSLVKRIQKDLGISDKEFAPRAILSRISAAKNAFLTPENLQSMDSRSLERAVATVFEKYEKEKQEMNALDFDDLIVLPVRIFEKYPEILEKYRRKWQFISVDEFQDTNPVQFRFLHLLASVHRNLCVIGDSDQSIYAFRGADISNILDFQKHFTEAKMVKLEENYRSTQNILDAADGVIEHNENRVPKKMRTDNGAGEVVQVLSYHDEREESWRIAEIIRDFRNKEGKKYSDFAILVRTNAQTRPIEEAFLRAAIPYQIIGGLKFYARKEVKDVLAYLRFLENPSDTESFLRIINLPPRKIGKTTLARLSAFAQERNIPLGNILNHLDFADGIPPAAREALGRFRENIQSIRKKKSSLSPADLIGEVLETFRLEPFYRDGTQEGETRYENILELKSVAHKFDHVDLESALSLFLEEVALVSDADNIAENEQQRVLIMTIHSSKGLEFPIVFLPGLEEGILPHSRSLFDPQALEEERRLLYVGMTRAMKQLFLLFAESRMMYGNTQYNPESRFLSEIPSHCSSGFSTAQEFGFTVEEEEMRYVPEFEIGETVKHPIFGRGSISKMEGDIAEIIFETVGKKRVALSIAPLTKG
ncbi:UvrD-helicase domain-containing protein [Candidatus Peregrinibacteria bacterium]|nr:MAG: UvrD-helicase domain-containing protein [Candidatus Peregrinibacteria bacterium]